MEIAERADAPLSRAEKSNGAVAIEGARTQFRSRAELEKARRLKLAKREYGRGRGIDVKTVKDKKLRRNLANLENKYQTATVKAKEAEILLENSGGFLEPETELVSGK